MENHEQNPAATPAAAPRTPGNRGRNLIIGGIAIVALGGIGMASALSHDHDGGRGWGPRHHAEMRAGPMGGMPFGGMGMGRMLDRIDATSEQEDKLDAIFDQLRKDVRPVARSMRDSREDVARILGAETIDRAAAEKLRSERIAEIDQASQKVTAALLDAAEVLTPEQRAKLVEQFKDRAGRGRW